MGMPGTKVTKKEIKNGSKKIIITGGATRIGAAIAKKGLSGSNKEIVIHYNKSKAKAENLKKNYLKKKN